MNYLQHCDVYQYKYKDRFYRVDNLSKIKNKFNSLCRDIREENISLDWKNVFTFSHIPIFDIETNEIKKEYDMTAMDVVNNIVYISENVGKPEKIYVVVRKYYYREEENVNPELHFPFCNRRICKDSINYSLHIIRSPTYWYKLCSSYGKIVCDTMPTLNIIWENMRDKNTNQLYNIYWGIRNLRKIDSPTGMSKKDSEIIEDFLDEFYFVH